MFDNEIIIAFNLIDSVSGRTLSGPYPKILRVPRETAENIEEFLKGCARLKEYIKENARSNSDIVFCKVVGSRTELRIAAEELGVSISSPAVSKSVKKEKKADSDIAGDWLNQELRTFGYSEINRARVDWDRFRDYAVNALISSGQTVEQIRRNLYFWVRKTYGESRARAVIALI